MKIVTHDGKFHADEVLAIATLMLLYGPNIETVRTRDRQLIAVAKETSDWVVLDVGGEFDPARNNFDHHQVEGAGFRDMENRYPYATAGLIWRYFGYMLLSGYSLKTVDEKMHRLGTVLLHDELDEVFTWIDERLFRGVDAVDCGIHGNCEQLTFSSIISMMNGPGGHDSEVFEHAVLLAKLVLENLIAATAGPAVMAKTIREIADSTEHPNILVLNSGMPWKEVISREYPNIKIVVVPTDSGHWNVQIAQGSTGVPRCSFPKDWHGKELETLAEVTRIHDAIFCHRTGFIAAAKSKESAMNMALAAVQS